jgi:hypothetical protein
MILMVCWRWRVTMTGGCVIISHTTVAAIGGAQRFVTSLLIKKTEFGASEMPYPKNSEETP